MVAATVRDIFLYSGSKWEKRRAIGLLATSFACSPDGWRISVAQRYRILLLNVPLHGAPIISVAVDCVSHALASSIERLVVAPSEIAGHCRLVYQAASVALSNALSAAVDVDFCARHMDFSSDGRRLLTEHGALALPAAGASAGTPRLSRGRTSLLLHFRIDREWISCMGRNILWVPPACRAPYRRALLKHGFAWADRGGIGRYLEFDTSLMSELGNWPLPETLQYKWRGPNAFRNLLEGLVWMYSY
jgi:hypothetical protein